MSRMTKIIISSDGKRLEMTAHLTDEEAEVLEILGRVLEQYEFPVSLDLGESDRYFLTGTLAIH